MSGALRAKNAAAMCAYVLGRGASTLARGARGARRLPSAAGTTASRVSPLAGGTAITALGGLFYGWSNARKWKQGKITGEAAVRHTANESVGIGLATGVGLAVANLVAATVWITSAVALAPFLVGAAATTAAKTAWDRAVREDPSR